MSRYLGNKNTKQYHDRQNPTSNCQIPEIKDRVYFATKQQAKQAGYDPCHYCIGD